MIALLLLAVVAPAAPSPKTVCPATTTVGAKNIRSVEIVGDWQDDREAAWTNARQKAFETACRPYKVVGSSIAVKGPQRRVKLRIEWSE